MQDEDDDTIMLAMIHELTLTISPRIVITDFPQTEYQAKFFIKNATHPSHTFILNCSKDFSQERMSALSESDPEYLPSSLLSQRIGVYNENLKALKPFLQSNTICSEINTESIFKASFKEMCAFIEPTVIIVRTSGSKEATHAKNSIMTGLVGHGFMGLDVNDLIQLEVQRQTEIGKTIQDLLTKGRNVWSEPEEIVKILKKIIYSGVEGNDKFLLIGFPDQIDHS